jgi:hypothetical protein
VARETPASFILLGVVLLSAAFAVRGDSVVDGKVLIHRSPALAMAASVPWGTERAPMCARRRHVNRLTHHVRHS